MDSLVSDIPAGDGKIVNLFLQCIPTYHKVRFFPKNVRAREEILFISAEPKRHASCKIFRIFEPELLRGIPRRLCNITS
jgi:hypothetical protein